MTFNVGVLALQGGFAEHVSMLERAAAQLCDAVAVSVTTVRTPTELAACDALIIPGGESTAMARIASQSGLMEPLRDFVRTRKKPTWGSCAGLVLLSREATGTKLGGQELIGGLDVRVHRNHFGRQKESFVADVHIPRLASGSWCEGENQALREAPREVPPFPCVFIRAPVVEALLPHNAKGDDVDVLAVLEGGDIVAVQQDNVLGTSFHPELTDDIRLHTYWLRKAMASSRQTAHN